METLKPPIFQLMVDGRGAKILLVFYTEKEDTCDYNSFTKIPEYTELVIFEHTALVM
jgi:hypothetical protein